MQTLERLNRQIVRARELKSIVHTMKAMAASNIGQYEAAVGSLENYYRMVRLGIGAYFNTTKMTSVIENDRLKGAKETNICAIVFGSDQGFVGQFNDSLTDYVLQTLNTFTGKKEIWTVGERIPLLLTDTGLKVSQRFALPNSVNAITSLIETILIKVQESHENGPINEFHVFHNHLNLASVYTAKIQRLLPLDQSWKKELTTLKWPTKTIPEFIGNRKTAIEMLIKEYLFVSLYKACSESLASENYSRLGAMLRAEKNIEELLDTRSHTYHRLRQSSIDEELFDVVSGFEALKEPLK
jgi:F-type H+-transporting ATPase subunit gamma